VFPCRHGPVQRLTKHGNDRFAESTWRDRLPTSLTVWSICG